ncbi:MAG: TetR family transcriptional regulator [Planctomycetes bacterium]|nr:TetR family transcriptional regulator [Planctomycetota bacterium]
MTPRTETDGRAAADRDYQITTELVDERTFIDKQTMARPRTVEDAEIVAAAGRVIGRVGPAKLTLALVVREVGLAPATLIQRFGSKRGLLLALGKSGGEDDGGAFMEKLRRKHGSPLAVLRAFLLGFAEMAKTPHEMANHLAAFQMDLADPELREVTRKILEQNETSVARLLREALDAGEIQNCAPDLLAPVLLTVAQGSLLSWSVFRKGTARRWVKRHLDTTLAPYLRESP